MNRLEAALKDLETIRKEANWLTSNLADLDAIAHSQRHQEADSVHVGHQETVDSPDLSATWDPKLRENLRVTYRLLRHQALAVTAARVGLEKFLAGDSSGDDRHHPILVTREELDAARAAKTRRDRNQGDYRWGEHEFTADQPNQTFRG